MSFKKSQVTVCKNKEKWTKNLTRFDQKARSSRGHVAIQESSLATISRMPTKEQLVGRYKFLEKDVKSRKQRTTELSKEVTLLWRNKLNFPMISEQAVRAKIEKVLQLYDTCCRKGKFEPLHELFDITKLSGEWLNAADKDLYSKQVDSKGRVGYSTGKLADKKTIHPSKRRSCKAVSSGKATAPTECMESMDASSICETDELDDGNESEYSGLDESYCRALTKRQ